MSRVRSSGWHCEVVHPETGRVLRPEILDDPQIDPSLFSMAGVRIPIRRDPSWFDVPTPADMTLWLDGDEQPIDELREVEGEQGRTVLVGSGGVELENRVTEEFTSERRHLAAEQLINEYTTYAADVDEPDVTELSDVGFQDADTTGEWDALSVGGADSPVRFDGDRFRLYDTCHYLGAREYESSTGTDTFISSEFSGSSPDDCVGDAVQLRTVGETVTYQFTTAYEWPAGEWQIAARYAGTDGLIRTETRIDGNVGTGISGSTGADIGDVGANDILWFTQPFEGDENGSAIPAGTHTVEIELVENPNDGRAYIDSIAPYDTRLSYNFDNDVTCVNGVNLLDGPGRVGDLWLAEFDDFNTPFSIPRADASLTDIAKQLQLSPDSGGTWLPSDGTETDTDSVDVAFENPTDSVRSRIGIGGHSPNGTRDETPRENYASQSIDAYELRGDIIEESLLVDAEFDDDLETVLNEITGEQSDLALWSYRLVDGQPTITWTQPGQRVADRDPNLGEATTRKEGITYPQITVKGSDARISDEPFTASTAYVSLARDRLRSGRESVFDPASGENFERAVDYDMRYRDGEIRIREGGDMVAGETYRISYDFGVEGTYTAPDAGADPRERIVTIPGVTRSRQAEQIAFGLVSEFNSPRYRASLFVPRSDVPFDVIEALTLENLDLPDEATPLAVREQPELTPRGLSIEAGQARDLEQRGRELARQVRRVARRS